MKLQCSQMFARELHRVELAMSSLYETEHHLRIRRTVHGRNDTRPTGTRPSPSTARPCRCCPSTDCKARARCREVLFAQVAVAELVVGQGPRSERYRVARPERRGGPERWIGSKVPSDSSRMQSPSRNIGLVVLHPEK